MVNCEVLGSKGHSNLSSAAHRLTHDATQDAEAGDFLVSRADAFARHLPASSFFHNHRNGSKILNNTAQRRRHFPSAHSLMAASGLLLLVSCLSWQLGSFPSGASTHILGDHPPYSSYITAPVGHRRLEGAVGRSFNFHEYEDEEALDYWGAPPAPESRFQQQEQELELFRWVEGAKPPPDRSSQVLIVMPACCPVAPLDSAKEEACYRHILATCPMTAPDSCFASAVEQIPCQGLIQPSEADLSYLAALRDAVPFLQELGWTHLGVVASISDGDVTPDTQHASSQNPGCVHSKPNIDGFARINSADIILADISAIPELHQINPHAWFLAVDAGRAATLNTPVGMEESILAVLKPQVLKPLVLNNRYLLHGLSHLAFIPGARDDMGYVTDRRPALSDDELLRIKPLLTHTQRFRHPLECGGSLHHLKYLGLFMQNYTHYRPPLLQNRSVDLLYVSSSTEGKMDTPFNSILQQHHKALLEKLKEMQQYSHNLNISILNEDDLPNHSALVAALQSAKLVVSPYGLAEWSDLDFDAMLNGCLLFKPRAGSLMAFPDVFHPDEAVIEVAVDWKDLDRRVQDYIRNPREAQRKAWRAARDLLEMSEPHRYADFVDRLLLSALEGVRQHLRPRLGHEQAGEAPKLDSQGLPEETQQRPKEISKKEALKMFDEGVTA
eukprot:jgi/Botrbrau1/9526/Bobra.0211s0017.1